MKYLFLLLFASFMQVLPTVLDAQCPTGNVTLSSQAAVNNFAVNYPNCSQISGDLIIEGSDITDLSPLANLQSVTGDLDIRFNPVLTNLQGLNNISSVGGYLLIIHNDVLTSLQGLNNLSSVGTFLSIDNNDALTTLQGLENISSAVAYLEITNNAVLTSLQGLENLPSVGLYLEITDNPVLTSLQGLENISSVGFFLQISNNDALTSLQGLNNFSSVGSYLGIDGNAALTSLQGLENLSSVNSIFISDNPALTSLQALENISSLGSYLAIENNAALTSLQGLNNLSSVGSLLSINNNDALTSLQALENISSVGSYLSIENNAALTSLQGLNNLSSVDNFLRIENNAALTSLQGLNNLSSVGSYLSIENNAVLTSLNGLETLSFVDGSVTITNNPTLSSCSIDWICDNINNPAQTMTISNNATGCNSKPEVEIDCLPNTVVNSAADNLTAGDGNCTLREAIRNVNAGTDLSGGDCGIANTIVFDPAINGTPIVLSIAGTDEDAAATGDLDITADVTITGNGSGNTIIDGNDIDRVFHLPPAAASLNVTLEHLTVKDGLLTGSNFGGGLNSGSNNANLIISNCAFESNQASRGGGLRIESASTVEIDNCLFNGNIASESYGGGVSLSIGAYTIRNCFFQNNQAGVRGGGAATHSGAYTFINCTMTGNTATNGGGAIENSSNSGSVTLTNCTIAENTSINGAAVDINNNNAFLSLTNNIIVNNISSSDLKIVGVSPQVNVQNIVESCSISCPTFFSTSDDVICGLSTCANGLSYYPVIPNSDADGTADTSTPLADDICGNSRSTSSYNIGSSEVFFTDNESPTAICQNITMQLDANGNAALSGMDIDNGSTDNCGVASFSAEPNSFTCDNVGTNSVTLTVTDDSNNDNTCTATVTVQDTDVPTAICQNITIQLDADGNAALSGMDIDNGSTDNCGVASFSAEPNAFTCDNVGTNSVTLTVTDDSNNDNTCTATVTVQDTEAPVVTCNDFTVFLDASGEAFIPAGDLGSTTDNCGGLGASSSPSFVDCNDVGQVTSSIVATDNAGNQSSCNGTITVVDNLPPAISCPADVTLTVDAGQTYATVVDIAPASSDDNCASPTITHTISGATTGSGGSDASGTQFNVGSSVVTYTIEDASNNTASCSFNVEVNGNAEIDVQDPDMNSLTSNISNYDFGNVDIMGGSASGTFTINNIGDVALLLDGAPTVAISGSASFSVTQPALTTVAPAGSTTFQISYNPANDNCSEQMATISIDNNDADESPFVFTVSATPIDNVNPTVNCPANITQSNDTGDCGANVTFSIPDPSDNCPGVSTMASPASGSFFDVGTTQVTVTATATDAVGNTSQCTFDVVVNDTENPVANCSATQTVSNDPGECGAVVSFSIPDPADNCAGVTASANPASGSFFDVGTTEVAVTATDAAGNTGHCTFDVVVNDVEAPVPGCPADIIQANDPGMCGAVANFTLPDVSDNCPGATQSASMAADAVFSVGTTKVMVTATDAADNSASCTFDVTVNDTEAPDMACQNATVEIGQELSPAQIDGGSTDNCAIAQLSVSANTFGCADVGDNTVTLTASDAVGNISSCTATVTVLDNNMPTAVCADITADIEASEAVTLAASDIDGGAVSFCGNSLDLSIPPTTFDCNDLGSTVSVTLTVTDNGNGLTDQCTANVTVADPNSFCCAPPAAMCDNITVQLDASGNASITPAEIGSGSTAECGLASQALDIMDFDCSDVGGNTVTIFAPGGLGRNRYRQPGRRQRLWLRPLRW